MRRAEAKHELAWRERLSFLGPDCLVIHGHPGKQKIRIEVYGKNRTPLRIMAEVFGGKVEKFDASRIAARANAPRKPLSIGRAIGVIDAHGKWPACLPRPRILFRIGSAMAFGTGEHATTSACLRFLSEESKRCESDWNCIDLGTGSGILAIAAEKLGAREVSALDYDARAVKAARANLRRNRCRRVKVRQADLFKWGPGQSLYRIVLANVFSEVLRSAAPQIVRSVRPRGCLILSGILRPQEREVIGTFRQHGMRFEKAARRGKWVTLQMRAR